MEENRFAFWSAVVTTGGAALMVGFAVVGLVVLGATGLARIAYAVVGVINLVAAVVGGLLVRQHRTGRETVDETTARFGSHLCVVTGVFLPQAMSTVDEPDWRALFFALGLLVAAIGLATVAVAPRAVRARLGLGVEGSN